MSTPAGRHVLRSILGTLLVFGGILGLTRCDLADPVPRKSLVVEAFLKTGRPPPKIILRQTRPLDHPGDRRAHAAQGATVELILDGTSIPYRSAEQPGRYVPVGTHPDVPARVSWRLRVQWRGAFARAHGTTPPPIRLKEMCVDVPEAPVRAIRIDSLRRDSLDIPAKQGYIYPVDVTLRWSAEGLATGEDTTYWVRPRLDFDTTGAASRVVSFFLEPVEVRREDQFRRRNGRRVWTGVYAVPVDDSTSAFPRHDLTATLTRGDTAFAAFARSRDDPERREPISNVEGALGIATAVALDSLHRRISSDAEHCRSR
ncbi:MAG: DUF4249 family protein [Salinibacter sp.]